MWYNLNYEKKNKDVEVDKEQLEKMIKAIEDLMLDRRAETKRSHKDAILKSFSGCFRKKRAEKARHGGNDGQTCLRSSISEISGRKSSSARALQKHSGIPEKKLLETIRRSGDVKRTKIVIEAQRKKRMPMVPARKWRRSAKKR